MDSGRFVSLPPPKPMRENWFNTPLSLFRGLSIVPLLPVVSTNEWALGLRAPMPGPSDPRSFSGNMIGGILWPIVGLPMGDWAAEGGPD